LRRALIGVGLAMTALLVGMGALVSVNALGRQTVQEESTYAFDGKLVSIDLGIGEVEIVPSPHDDEISVRRRLTYGLRRPFVEERLDGDTFRIRDGQCPVPVVGICEVRWLLQLPRHVSVEVTTNDGSITASGLTGPVKLVSTSGDVRGRALSGPAIQLLSHHGLVVGADIRSKRVVATSESGAVSVSFRSPPTLMRAGSKTGDVHVGLPDGDETYKVSAVTKGLKTTPKSDPESPYVITVTSDTGRVSVLQSPEN
jgi:hypothetical protein